MLKTRTALATVALVALPLVALTACSSSSSPSASSSTSSSGSSSSSSSSGAKIARPSDPCTILSAAEVAGVIGGDVGDTYSASDSCGYGGTNIQFSISPTEVDWATAVSIAKVQYGSKLKTISGLGDQAMEAPNFIEVRKSNIIFSIDDPDGDGDTTASYQALAKIVLSHLG
jgi:hypothetical protein